MATPFVTHEPTPFAPIPAYVKRQDSNINTMPAEIPTMGVNGRILPYSNSGSKKAKRQYDINTMPAEIPTMGVNGQILPYSNNGGNKANPRANTAEHHATHNSIERARRETLNGRFFDLAALLPQLASVRRLSKFAIVDSSIAIIHQARRPRFIAARELRQLRAESDALRRENNEWRARAGLPHVDEPTRSSEFMNLVNLQETEGSGGNGWEGEALGEMGEEERRAYELALAEKDEDRMEDGDEDFVRMANTGPFKPATTTMPSGPVVTAQMPVYNQQRQQQIHRQQVVQPQACRRCTSHLASLTVHRTRSPFTQTSRRNSRSGPMVLRTSLATGTAPHLRRRSLP
jgi:hypothetical protein